MVFCQVCEPIGQRRVWAVQGDGWDLTTLEKSMFSMVEHETAYSIR